MVYGLGGDHHFRRRLHGQGLAGLGIGIVEGNAGAGHADANSMPLVEDLAEVANVKGDLVHLARLHEDLAIPGLAKAGAADPVHDQDRTTVRIDIGYTNDEVGVGRSGRDEEFRANFACPLHWRR